MPRIWRSSFLQLNTALKCELLGSQERKISKNGLYISHCLIKENILLLQKRPDDS